MTPLDQAHARMEANVENETTRMQFYERVADSELFLILEQEPARDKVSPLLFEVDDQNFALVFDTEARMSEFTGSVTPFVAMSGRAVVEMLQGNQIGLGLNLGVAPSSILLPAEAVDWLKDTLGQGPEQLDARAVAVFTPGKLPEVLIQAFDAKLSTMQGLAKAAYLAEMEYENRRKAHVLAFVDAVPEAHNAMAAAVSEALRFSGIEAGTLDVVFLNSTDPICGQMSKVALRFDLPEPETETMREVQAPGMDPDVPPILR